MEKEHFKKDFTLTSIESLGSDYLLATYKRGNSDTRHCICSVDFKQGTNATVNFVTVLASPEYILNSAAKSDDVPP